jgi:chromate transporter
LGTLPFWEALRTRVGAQAAMRGVNAAVVGLLGAAFYNPIWATSVKTIGDFVLVLFSFLLLMVFRIPSLVVVIITALGGVVLGILALLIS